MAVRIRMKKLGRKHRPFFRICAMDQRTPRDGKVLEELGTYDPMVRDPDARAVLLSDRIQYWLGVGAQPSEKVKVLIKKYGADGSHVDQQRAALERLSRGREIPDPGPPASTGKPAEATAETAASEPAETAASEPAPTESGDSVAGGSGDRPADDATAEAEKASEASETAASEGAETEEKAEG